ncbi:hypothetical protein [Streptomyces parvus]
MKLVEDRPVQGGVVHRGDEPPAQHLPAARGVGRAGLAAVGSAL